VLNGRVERASREQRNLSLIHLSCDDLLRDAQWLHQLELTGDNLRSIGVIEVDRSTDVRLLEEWVAILYLEIIGNRRDVLSRESLRRREAEVFESGAEVPLWVHNALSPVSSALIVIRRSITAPRIDVVGSIALAEVSGKIRFTQLQVLADELEVGLVAERAKSSASHDLVGERVSVAAHFDGVHFRLMVGAIKTLIDLADCAGELFICLEALRLRTENISHTHVWEVDTEVELYFGEASSPILSAGVISCRCFVTLVGVLITKVVLKFAALGEFCVL
jgi:hypothetical protein